MSEESIKIILQKCLSELKDWRSAQDNEFNFVNDSTDELIAEIEKIIPKIGYKAKIMGKLIRATIYNGENGTISNVELIEHPYNKDWYIEARSPMCYRKDQLSSIELDDSGDNRRTERRNGS